MSSGGGGGGPSSQTVTQSNLPTYAQPYYEQMMGQASVAEQQPYQQYGGNVVAGMNGNQLNALQGYYGMQNSAGTNAMSNAAQIANNAAQNPYQTGTFTNANTAQQYMNPYVQNVIDVQKNAALRDYQIQQAANHNNMAQQGAFGGSRQAIMDSEAQRALTTNLANIEAQGYNNAFTNAQQQFNTEQQQGLSAAGLNANTAIQGANTLGNIGSTMNAQGMNALQGISGIGNTQQQVEQNQMNAAYNNFQNQVYWPQNQIGWYSNILHGTPTGTNSVQANLLPGVSPLSTVSGVGLAALGASKS